jgi:hypothetical protein
MTIQDHSLDRRDGRRVSLRLEQILRVYCTELRPSALTDLRDSIFDGHHAWFRREFADAITGGAFTPAYWHEVTGTRPAPGREDEEVRRQQRQIWQALFAGEAFPTRRRP